MAAGRYNFLVEQGATTQFNVVYTDAAGSPINISDYHARMQIRETIDSSTIIACFSSSLQPDGSGLRFNTPLTSGSFDVYISAATSSLFNFETAVYDIEFISASIVTRLLQGTIALSKEVTKNGC